MRKFNFLLSIMLLFSAVLSAQQYDQSTSVLPLAIPDGTPTTITLPALKGPAGDGILSIHYQGDFDGGGENAEIFDENNVLIGIIGENGDQCNDPMDTTQFVIPRATLQSWVLDGNVDITFDPAGTVNPTLCGADSFQVRLEYNEITATNNAAVTSIEDVELFCAGSQDVFANIANLGLNQIDSVNIIWEVNGIAQPTFVLKTLLDTINGNTSFDTLLNLGSATFNADTNNILVYTSLPNGVADTVNFDDTSRLEVYSSNAPENIQIINILTDEVSVLAENFPGDLDYEYGLKGFSLYSGNTGTSTTAPFTITGLTSGTDYQIYLRNDCGSNDTSDWVGPIDFTTAFEVTFVQDVENFNQGDQSPFGEGWTSSSENGVGVTPRWEVERANGANRAIGGNAGPVYDKTLFGTNGGKHFVMNSWLAPFGQRVRATLTSPPVFISNAQEKVKLTYGYFMFGQNIEGLEVIVDTNGVEDTVAIYEGPQQSAQTDDWLVGEHYLTGYAGKSVIIKFVGISAQTQARLAVDDIRIDTLGEVSTAVTALVAPSGALCPGAQTPIVRVENSGKDDITTFQIVSDINGVLDTTSFIETISTGETVDVTLPSVTFATGIIYDMRFYTINPNGGADDFNDDDTLTIDPLTTGLDGIVTIDASIPASASNFTTFRALASRLNTVGVCGNVTVNVAAGDYIGDNFILENVDGLSETNRLSVDGVHRDSVTLQNSGTNSRNATLGFINTSYVTVKNMKVVGRYSGVGAEFGAFYSGGASYDSLVNIFFDMDEVFNIYGIGASADITNVNNRGNRPHVNFLTALNCEIDGAQESVTMLGPISPNDGFNTGNKFIGTKAYRYSNYAFRIYTADSLVIDSSEIFNSRSAFERSIWIQNTMNFRITKNKITSQDDGIYSIATNSAVDPQLNAVIANNMITAADYAMYLRAPLRVNLWYNSVRTEDENLSAVHLDGGVFIDSMDVRNNIFYSENSPAFQMEGGDDTTIFQRLDNNVYYRQSPGVVIDMDGTNYLNLSAYQAATPRFNVNSVEGDPQFDTQTDLHIIGVLPNDGADITVPMLSDIDGDVRPSVNALFPDIGADEYDPPSCPPPSGLTVQFIRADSVLVTWESQRFGNKVFYEYGLEDFRISRGTDSSSTNDSARIGKLAENTSYDIYIKEVCGRGDTSRYAGPLTFKTPCFPKAVGYFNDFDTDPINETPECWTQFYNNDGQDYAEVRNVFAQAYSGTRVLRINTWSQQIAGDSSIAISPVLDSITLGNRRLRFFAQNGNISNALIVGTTNSVEGRSAFRPLDTIEFDAVNAWKQYYVDLTVDNEYNGVDQYIAMYNTGTAINGISFIDIDDFRYEKIPTCLAPRDPRMTYVGSDSAEISWTDLQIPANYEIEYDIAPLTIGSGNRVTTTTKPGILSGLSPNTDYEVVIRGLCSATDSSFWTETVSFKTECLPQTVGVFENWDGMTANQTPDCWMEWKTYEVANVNGPWVRVINGFNANNGFSPTQALVLASWFNYNATTDTLMGISPRYSDMTDGDKRIRFHANGDDVRDILQVFTTNSRGSGGTYNLMSTITFDQEDTWGDSADYHTVDLTTANGYNGTDEYIAFSYDLVDLNTFSYIRIDDYYYEDIPSCPRPENQTAIAGPDTAVVTWTSSTLSDTTELRYFLADDGVDSAVYSTLNGLADTLRGLRGGSFYNYSVRTICGPGDTSDWSRNFEFVTECVPIEAPFFTGFENDRINEAPQCWLNYTTQNPQFAGALVTNFNANTGTQLLEINNWQGSTNTDTTMGITPELSRMGDGDKRLRFFASSSNVNNGGTSLVIMTADNYTPAANFTPIDTILFTVQNDYQQYYVDLTAANGYNGTDSVVAFVHGQENTFTDIRIDDWNYENIPTCLAPRDLTAKQIGPDSANLGWTSFDTETEWEVEYSLAPLTIGSGTRVIMNSNPATLSGLMENSLYEYVVRAVCTPGDSSFWSASIEFETPCFATTAPFFEDFEGMTTFTDPDCWALFMTYDPAFNNWGVRDPFQNGNANGTNSLFMNSWNNFVVGDDTLSTVLPEFSDLTDGDKRIRFFASTANGNNAVELYVWTANSRVLTDASNIDIIDTVYLDQQNTLQEFVVNFDTSTGYDSVGTYIHLVHDLGSTFNAGEVYIDDMNYEEIPTCFRVSDIEGLAITDTSVELSWTDPNGTPAAEYEIEYGPSGFARGNGITKIATTNPDTLGSIVTSTYYDVYVTSICTVGDTSFVTKGDFISLCDNLPDGYTTSFEDVVNDSVSACWTKKITFATGPPYIEVNNENTFVFTPRTGDKALYINGGWNSTATDTVMLTTPKVDSLLVGNRRMKLWLSSQNNFASLIVGTSSSPTGFVTALDTLNNSANNLYEEFTVDFTSANGYNGTDEHIIFMHDLQADFTTLRIEDILIERIPTCLLLEDLGAFDIGSDSARINWSDVNFAPEYEVAHDTTGFELGTGNRFIATNDTSSISGLSSGKTYDYYVRAICVAAAIGGDTSKWEGPFTFRTTRDECPAIVSLTVNDLPWVENFDTLGNDVIVGTDVMFCTDNTSWKFETDHPLGRIFVGDTAANPQGIAVGTQSGSGAIFMDVVGNVTPETAKNNAIVTINMDDLRYYTDLELSFSATMYRDDSHAGDSVWIRGFADDDPWISIFNSYDSTLANPGWKHYGPFNIVDTLRKHGQNVSQKFQIRFGQEDNIQVGPPNAGDGIGYDSIRIAGGLVTIVGVDENAALGNNISVYPNPSVGLFNLNIYSKQLETYKVTVRDIKGQIVYDENISAKGAYKKALDFTEQAKGVYFLQVQSDEMNYVEKLVIQ